jgi:hypothetical protein
MWVLAVIYFFTHNYRYIILAAFGFIALAIGFQDYICSVEDIFQLPK